MDVKSFFYLDGHLSGDLVGDWIRD